MGKRYTLDVCGEVCPMPVIKTKAMLDKMGPGEVLEVIVDMLLLKKMLSAWPNHRGAK